MGRMRLRRGAGALLVGAAVLAGAASGRAADDPKPAARAPEIHTVAGTIRSVTPAENAFTVETETEVVRLHFDLNTSVFLPERIATVRALEPGRRVRAAIDPSQHAYWVELQAPSAGHQAERRTRVGRPVLAAPRGREQRSSDASAASPGTGDAATDEVPGEPVPDPGAPPPPPPPRPGADMPPIHAVDR